MSQLVALDLPGGLAFVEALRRVWDRGDAAFPVDQRLPAPARSELLARMAPASIVGPDGDETRAPGAPAPLARGDALVVATSGTTGEPCGVVLTHEGLAAHARAVHRRLAVDRSTDRWLACLPLNHVGGLGVVVRAVLDDVGLDVEPAFDARSVASSPDRRGTTLVSLVPAALDRVEPIGFRWVVLGGSGDARSRPPNVVHTYGLTETGGGVVYGGVPLDDVEVHLVDGEVHLRGPSVLRCYRDGTDPRTHDGWLPTGDLGRWVDGRLAVLGRRGDLVVTGGENVWPTTVEAAVRTHPRVADVAVLGRADPDWGQRVVAVVVPVAGGVPPTLDDLRGHVKERLPAYAAPRELVLVDKLPRTALGKIRRDDLLR